MYSDHDDAQPQKGIFKRRDLVSEEAMKKKAETWAAKAYGQTTIPNERIMYGK